MSNFAPNVATFSTGTYMVNRPSITVTGTDGIKIPPSLSPFTVLASIVPAQGRALERLTEGTRVSEQRTMYCETPLLVRDLVTIGTESWEIKGVKDWSILGNFYEATLEKLGD